MASNVIAAPDLNTRSAGLRELFRHVSVQRSLIAVVVALSIVGAALSLAQPVLVREVIDRVSNSRPLGTLPVLVGVLVVVGGLLGGVRQYLIQRTAETAIRRSRHRLIDHILRLPVATLDRRRVGDLVARVNTDTTVVRNMLSQGLVESVAGVFTIVGALIGMFFLDPVLLAIAVVVSLLAVLAVVWVTTHIEKASLGMQNAVGRLSSSTDRAIRASRTVRAANATAREAGRVKQDADDAWQVGLRVARTTAVVSPISTISMQVTFLAVLGVGGWRVASGSLTVADLVSFVLFLFLLIMPMGQLFGTVGAVGEALGGVARINEVLALPTESDRPSPHRPVAEQSSASAVTFESVSFSYLDGGDGSRADEQEPATLTQVSFRAESGSQVALVGPSGAGKSTVLNLLARFYDPSAGRILLDGVDVEDLSRSEVRARIAYVEQDSPALAGTIRDNLVLGSEDIEDQCLVEILHELDLGDILTRSECGLDAEVGEGAVLLSGGERQRLAVARALLARPAILLLDESTSNLDGVNEDRVRQLIRRRTSGCTLIVVAHRLATVQNSDVILLLDQGRLVASGTHPELMATAELYRDLARNQLLAS